jgi:hypothetical protein
MRLANYKLDNKEIRKQGRGWTFVKKKNIYEVGPRIPINFRPRHWIITSQQINMKENYVEINRVQNESHIIKEK